MSDAAREAHLISPVDLGTALASGQDVVLLDVRHTQASDSADPDAFRAGHIPGAQFVDIDDDLAGTSTGANGARPLPEPDVLEQKVRRWGIDARTPVVVYGATRSPPLPAPGGCCAGPVSNRCDCSTAASTVGPATAVC